MSHQLSFTTEASPSSSSAPAAIAALVLFASLTTLACTDDRPVVTDQTISEQERLQLEGLGYVTWVDAGEEDASGPIVVHDRNQAEAGVNFFCSESTDDLHFIDMDGNLLWEVRGPTLILDPEENRCKLVDFYGDANVLMLHERMQITMLDFESNVAWAIKGKFHHDIAVGPDGIIYSITIKGREIPELSTKRKIRDMDYVRISPNGKVLSELSLFEVVATVPELLAATRKMVLDRNARDLEPRPLDVFHANTVEVLTKDLALGDGKFAKKGSVLTAIRNLNAIAIIDLERQEILWYWGTRDLDRPHQPTILPNGNILIFDNGHERKWSRIVEYDPRIQKIVWQYGEEGQRGFFSKTRGGVEGLPGGNVLITDSGSGKVFEVTRTGEKVWEFLNPLKSNDGKKRATIYRMGRLFPDGTNRSRWPAPLREHLEVSSSPLVSRTEVP